MIYLDKTISELDNNCIDISCDTHDLIINDTKEEDNYIAIIIYEGENNKAINDHKRRC